MAAIQLTQHFFDFLECENFAFQGELPHELLNNFSSPNVAPV